MIDLKNPVIKRLAADGFSVSCHEHLKGHRVIASFTASRNVSKQTAVLIHTLSSVV